MQVSGQVAVMAINEKLLQALMRNNPELSFALQESFPLPGTYGNAAPLGPIMELGLQDVQSAFTAERAAQSLDYWRGMAQQLAADPEASGSPETLKSYSKLALGQANLLADHQYSAEAEQAYRLSTQFWPGNIESVSDLSKLLLRTGRADEARRLMDDFERKFPDQKSDVEKARALCKFRSTPLLPPGYYRRWEILWGSFYLQWHTLHWARQWKALCLRTLRQLLKGKGVRGVSMLFHVDTA